MKKINNNLVTVLFTFKLEFPSQENCLWYDYIGKTCL